MAAAVILLVVCAFLLLGMAFNVGHEFGPRSMNHISDGQDLVFAAWGIATGVGIFLLSPWARASVILLSLFGAADNVRFLGMTLAYALWHPAASDARDLRFRHALISTVRLPLVLFLIFIWWLALFSRHKVGHQFESEAPQEGPSLFSQEPPLGVVMVVIGLLAYAAYAVPWIASLRFDFPRFFFGRVYTGSLGWILYLALMICALVLGVCLWRKQRWAHIGAVVFCILLIVNASPSLLSSFRSLIHHYPAMSLAMVSKTSSLTALLETKFPFTSAVWPGMALWILWTRRRAFARPPIVGGEATNADGGAA